MDPGAESTGLRERKKEQKRGRLKDAALDLFAERGFDDVTVDEIADRAEVSKSTLFRYFENKEDLILADTRAHGDAFLSAFAERPTAEPVLSSVRSSLHSLVREVQTDRTRFQQRTRIVSESATLSLRSLERQIEWENGLVQAILPRFADHDDPETRASIIAAATLAVIRIATRRWVAADDTSSLEDHLLPALDVLADELKGAD